MIWFWGPGSGTPSTGVASTRPPFRARDLIRGALLEIGVLDPVDAMPPEALEDGLNILIAMADTFEADLGLLYTMVFAAFTLTPNERQTTIGPGATFDTTAILGATAMRPVTLGNGTVIPAGETSEYPLVGYDRPNDYYLGEPQKDYTQDYPTRFLYEPTLPAGTISWWPVPTTAAVVNFPLGLPVATPLTADTVLIFPAGYLELWKYSLALRLCNPYRRKATPEMIELLREARGLVKRNNDAGPPAARCDGFSGGSRFDIYSNRTR